MTLLHQAAQKAVAVPLVEQLRSIPSDAKLRIDTPNALGCMDTCSIPVGRLCHEAAAALQQQPEPVADPAHMCGMQGFDGMLDICPACEARRTPPALQHQEVPREPVARPSMSMYASAADYSAAMDGWIATTRQCPACKGKFGVDGQACDLCNATGRVPSTTRQQEDGNV